MVDIMKLKFRYLIYLLPLLLGSVLSLLPMQKVQAYSGANIVSNAVFLDANSMSAADIQNFLASKNSGLTNMSFPLTCYGQGSREWQLYTALGAPCGHNQPASHIIFYASRVYGINPKVILATLQKEQSLITNPNPSSWNINQAMGYGCPTTGSCSDSSNFFYQLDSGTWVLRYHYERASGNFSWWHQSSSWTCGTQKQFYSPNLYPNQNVHFYDGNGVHYRTYHLANAATSSMYCYTPHAYNNPQGLFGRAPYGHTGQYYSGSYNFVSAFTSWFGSPTASSPYAWQFVSHQSFSDADRQQPFSLRATVEPEQTFYVTLKARNMGTQTWQRSNVRLAASHPIDRHSVFSSPSWITANRVARLVENSVAPGHIGTFEFEMQAPNKLGSHKEYFSLMVEGLLWMNNPGYHFFINVNQATSPSDTTRTLQPGESLRHNDFLLSAGRQNALSVTRSGRVVLFSNFRTVWQTPMTGNSNTRLVMQSDGNLVAYNQSNQPVWNSQTNGNPGAWAVLQTDGNFVIYSSSNIPLWSTGTVQNPNELQYINTRLMSGRLYPGQRISTADRRNTLVLQTDGNLVLYGDGVPLWATGTDGKDVAFLSMQGDGNLVLYSRNNTPLWWSGTAGQPNLRLIIQTDGNVVIYNQNNQPLWHTNTSRP